MLLALLVTVNNCISEGSASHINGVWSSTKFQNLKLYARVNIQLLATFNKAM